MVRASRAMRLGRGLHGDAGGDERPRVRHLIGGDQAGAWRAALSRTLQVPAGARVAVGARSAVGVGAAHHLAAPLRAAAPQGPAAGLASCGWVCSSTTISAGGSCCRQPRRWTCARDLTGKPLKPGIRRGFEYSDCWVDDARLVALNARTRPTRAHGWRRGPRWPRHAARQDGLWPSQMQGRAAPKR